MRGFEPRNELALAVACWFSLFIVMWWVCACVRVCVCVCVLGFNQCFWGSTECSGDGFLGIIDLLYNKLKKIRETTMSIYSNQRCIFS